MSEVKEVLDQQLGGTLSKADQFYQKNKKAILGAGVVLVVLVLGIIGYNYMQSGKEEEANTKLWVLENYFEKDSFDLVLNGRGGDEMGGIAFVDEYGSTPAGQKVAFMVGRIYMDRGDFENALEYLKKFNLKDNVMRPEVTGLIGDCYVELNQLDKAEDYFEDAAKIKNEFTAPRMLKKLGIVQESQGKFKEAAETYTKIRKDYKESTEGQTIDKYIGRASAKAGIDPFAY